MKIEVLQEQLIYGFNIVGRAVASRAQLPVLSHILIEAKNEGLVLSATDLEIGIKIKVAAKVIESGVVAVPAKMLGEFLSSLNPGKLELTTTGETLTVKAPGYSGKFQTISADEFPMIPELPENGSICTLTHKGLAEAVAGTVFASAKDSLRPVLTGVLWEFGKKKVRLVATDGFRLAVEEMAVDTNTQLTSLLIPARVVMEVVRLDSEEPIVVGHLSSTNQIYFVAGEVQIVSQLLSGNFPDYNKILPKEFTSEIKVSRDELLQAIKAAHIFARDNSNMVRWQVESSKLVLLSSSPERGECRVEVPIDLAGDDIEIIFNAKYVLDFLGIVTGPNLWIGLGGKLSPGMIRDAERDNGQYVVMPINA
ncbi:MAG: DNA polymerase III subunit beta [Microgenomates group bacterium]